jgi:hypothetical protein
VKVFGSEPAAHFKWKGDHMHITRNIGMLLLAIFLIAWGLVTLLGIGGLGAILAILAIAAGIFILLNR